MDGDDPHRPHLRRLARPGEPAFGPRPRSSAGRLRDSAMRGLSRVHAPLVWRALYGVLARPTTVALVARGLRALGPDRAEAAVARLEELTVWSGWPHQAPGWVNLDMSRFAFRLRRALDPPAPATAVRPPRAQALPLRVGLAGELSLLLTFSADHITALPDDVELSVFDTEYSGRHAGYLAAPRVSYGAFGSTGEVSTLQALAAAVDAADLDLLLLFVGYREAAWLADRVATPCIVYVPTGSDLLHHPRVGFHLYVQPEPDYFVRDGGLFCATSRAPFGGAPAWSGSMLYDARGIEERPRAWSEREPLIVFHGALYKLASEPYLDTILGLLEEDGELSFAFMGRGKDHELRLEAILERAAARGLAARVRYEGAYARFRDTDGRTIADPGWERLAELLRSARLAPNPFPMGGGSSRVEAYLLGAPTVHMAVRFDRAAWGRPQLSIVDLPALNVPRATACDRSEYESLCRRCLRDGAFADALAAEQLEVAQRVTDGGAFWRQLVEVHATWAASQSGMVEAADRLDWR